MEKSLEPHFSKEAESQHYEFFDYLEERQELFDYSKKIAEYLRSENVSSLVIIDRSSRPLCIGVMEYLRSKYPDEKMPNIYFMNPKGFKAREELSQEEILREFKGTYKKLMMDKEKPVLVFDTCIHSGGSLEPVKKVFDQAGFSDVRIGAVNPSEWESKVKTDFYITTQRPEKGCYPFDRDKIIEKTFDHVYSKRTGDPEKREKSLRLRREIKRIMNDFLIKE